MPDPVEQVKDGRNTAAMLALRGAPVGQRRVVIG